jgi:subtilase family serine protease
MDCTDGTGHGRGERPQSAKNHRSRPHPSRKGFTVTLVIVIILALIVVGLLVVVRRRRT